jgi:dynein light chain 4
MVHDHAYTFYNSLYHNPFWNEKNAAQLAKNTLDKKFGKTWHCVIGEGFGFDITCQRRYLLHVYYGQAAILCYKCES